ncbi:MAG TPA: energy transducer TonB [Sulfurimonas autotrophica]|nr:energy transducer TonB [Sulfurimonas autotrophica]
MRNYLKSLFLSLVIHALLLLGLLSVSKYVFPSGESMQKKEKKICVHLASIKQKTETKQKHKVQNPQHTHKKIVKKTIADKKVPVKKTKQIEKKVLLKKEMRKEEPKVIEKPVEPIQPVAYEELQSQKEKKTGVVANKTVVNKMIPKMSDEEEYLKENLAKIATLIKENLYYPRVARKRGIQGSVTVRFILLQDATVIQITTISSNSEILTRAAIKTIKELSGEFPRPKRNLTITLPIQYSLH